MRLGKNTVTCRIRQLVDIKHEKSFAKELDPAQPQKMEPGKALLGEKTCPISA